MGRTICACLSAEERLQLQPVALQQVELFLLSNAPTRVWGANQIWYKTEFKRRAGCGPTVGSHLTWYLSRTRPELAALCDEGAGSKEGMLVQMDEMWNYITPGRRGVNSTTMFTDGALRFAQDRGCALEARVLEIPPFHCRRPSNEEVAGFLLQALSADAPVAFLNLSNGALINLDNWHWVTLVGLDPAAMRATIVDQCHKFDINLDLWLRTSVGGGGFVALV